MSIFANKYGDFSDLDELVEILSQDDLVNSYGCYDEKQQHPGPHVMISGVDSKLSYDFIKQKDGTYILCVRKIRRINSGEQS